MTQKDDDHLPDDVVRRLLEALCITGLSPPPALKSRVMRRVMSGSAETIKTVRSADGAWTPFLPGVMAKVLSDDGARLTWLARLAAAACVPAHQHDGDEEIYLVEGSCHVGSVPMHAGDYQFSPSGTFHEEMTTTDGCLLLLRTRSPAAHATE